MRTANFLLANRLGKGAVSATHVVEESVAIPVPGLKRFHSRTLALRPLIAIRKWRIHQESRNTQNQKHRPQPPSKGRKILDTLDVSAKRAHASEDEIPDLHQRQDRKEEGGEIVVQEELALHEEEREIMERPAQHTDPDLVIEALESIVFVVSARALPPQHREALERNVEPNRRRAGPPDQGIADEVDLTVVFAPEIDAAFQHRPARRPRVPGVRLHEPGIGRPHDFLQFPEFAEEAGVLVVDFLLLAAHHGMRVAFDVPDGVGEGAAAGAGDFLLLEAPVRQLDFVAEEHAAGHDVHELELGLDGAEASFGERAVAHFLHDFHAEEVVGVAFEALVAVGGDFVLPVRFCDWGANVVGVQAAVRGYVIKAEDGAVDDVFGGEGVPG